MNNVFGKSFEFDSISSDTYNVVLCSFDTVDISKDTGINYDIQSGDITPNRPVANYYNKKYNKPLEFQVEICKPCGSVNYFTTEEQKHIVRWITSPVDYRKFTILDNESDGYHDGIEYFAICTEYQEKVINDKIIGLYFSFQCNAPYGYYTEQITTFDTSVNTEITIDNYSDELEVDYYPIIELTAGQTGKVTIKNVAYPDNVMELSVKNGQTLIIDNNTCDITDNIGLFSYDTDTNLKWISLVPGNNTLTITGNATGEIRCRYPRKVGI